MSSLDAGESPARALKGSRVADRLSAAIADFAGYRWFEDR
jgi:hypothetical protein